MPARRIPSHLTRGMSTPYTVHYPHSPQYNRVAHPGWCQFISIDPGLNNYAVRVERRCDNGDILTLYYDKVKLSLDNGSSWAVAQALETLRPYFASTHYVLVERQLPINYQMVRVAQDTISFMVQNLVNAPHLPPVLEVDPKLKSRMLQAPAKLAKPALKKWAITMAKDLLNQRGDVTGLQLLQGHRKQDDLSDILCQIEAICRLWHREPPSDPRLQVPPTLLRSYSGA